MIKENFGISGSFVTMQILSAVIFIVSSAVATWYVLKNRKAISVPGVWLLFIWFIPLVGAIAAIVLNSKAPYLAADLQDRSDG
jgi:hypothetical protein